jgi:hypothetical protein
MRKRAESKKRAAGREWPGLVVLGLAVALAALPVTVAEDAENLIPDLETEHEAAARAAVNNGGEALRLRWKLGGFLGTLAGLFIPSSGDALVTFVPNADNRIDANFLVTAPRRDGEYFLYGARIDEASGAPVAVWSSQMFREELKQRGQRVEEPDIIDYASAIYLLRWAPPEKTTRMTIWNEGKTYPVEIEPLRPGRRKIAGMRIEARGYAVRGVKVDGKRPMNDKIWVYFAANDDSTPVEIVGKRGLIKVRIQLVTAEGRPRPPKRTS